MYAFVRKYARVHARTHAFRVPVRMVLVNRALLVRSPEPTRLSLATAAAASTFFKIARRAPLQWEAGAPLGTTRPRGQAHFISGCCMQRRAVLAASVELEDL
jgi:hypothetical protein